MKKQIELHDKNIEYTLRLSRRSRSLRISVYCDGTCVVHAPAFVGLSTIEKFIREKSGWIVEKLNSFLPFRPKVRAKNLKADYLKYRDQALKLAEEKCHHFNSFYGFTFNKISVRNQKTRWGSCSKRGNLNFNYKIALLPPHLADYLVVHELCHLGQFNHSQRFWDLVGKTLPNYRELRNELKKHIIKPQ